MGERGSIRIRQSGSAGTHNGMRSVIDRLNTQEFPRIRIGTGPLPPGWQIIDFVLSEIPPEYQQTMFSSFGRVAEAVETMMEKAGLGELHPTKDSDNSGWAIRAFMVPMFTYAVSSFSTGLYSVLSTASAMQQKMDLMKDAFEKLCALFFTLFYLIFKANGIADLDSFFIKYK